MRIGHGYDAHHFAPDRELVLGGVRIPHERGLAAHSDGDAVIHALCDALLGAAGLDDIGCRFPDTDAAHKGADSRIFLRQVMAAVRERGLRVENMDITVLAQRPRLAPHCAAIRQCLSKVAGVPPGRIGIKASTNEGMGFVGREEGLAAHAVVLLAEDAPAPGNGDA